MMKETLPLYYLASPKVSKVSQTRSGVMAQEATYLLYLAFLLGPWPSLSLSFIPARASFSVALTAVEGGTEISYLKPKIGRLL